jgi:hypothetical protein
MLFFAVISVKYPNPALRAIFRGEEKVKSQKFKAKTVESAEGGEAIKEDKNHAG